MVRLCILLNSLLYICKSELRKSQYGIKGFYCATAPGCWKAGQAYQRNPIDWSLVDSMHDHRMAECMQSYVCLVLISVRDKVMVAGVFHIRDKSHNL